MPVSFISVLNISYPSGVKSENAGSGLRFLIAFSIAAMVFIYPSEAETVSISFISFSSVNSGFTISFVATLLVAASLPGFITIVLFDGFTFTGISAIAFIGTVLKSLNTVLSSSSDIVSASFLNIYSYLILIFPSAGIESISTSAIPSRAATGPSRACPSLYLNCTLATSRPL